MLYYDWPPSICEIDAIMKDKKVEVLIQWPTSELQRHQVDETTTVESLLQKSVWTQVFFHKEPESQLYWLYTCEDNLKMFPKPLGREKKILKLVYKDEIAQERFHKTQDEVNKKLS